MHSMIILAVLVHQGSVAFGVDDIEFLKGQFKIMEDRQRYLEEKVETQEKELASLRKQVIRETTNGTAPLGHKRQIYESVAFTAYLSHSMDLQDHQVISFDKVITIIGNAYDTTTGIFTAPFDGVYLIHFTLKQRDMHKIWAALMVNNRDMLDAVVETSHGAMDAQSSNMAVFQLNAGSKVWVRARSRVAHDPYHVEGATNARFTTFSAVYLPV